MSRGSWGHLSAVLACVALCLGNSPAGATPNEALVCPADEPKMDKYRYLRSISLVLRGVVPTLDEYDGLDDLDDVPEALINEWMETDEFAQQVSRMHRALFWNRVTQRHPFSNAARRLRTYKGSPLDIAYVTGVYREINGLSCKDEPAEFTESGKIITTWHKAGGWQEGYVEVVPYWDPTTKVKVCAFLAQTAMISPTGTICSSREAIKDPGCGCGPNLQWCHIDEVHEKIMESAGIAVDLMIEDIVKSDRPYTDIFLASKQYLNGPLAHMWRHLANFPSNTGVSNSLLPTAIDSELIPDYDYTDANKWLQVEFPPEHAGVLTSVAYLLRFQTNRRRARRFYEAMLCQPFMPPTEGLALDKKTALEPDLQIRQGCKYCHAGLDPAAAYWSRWGEYSAGYLPPDKYPDFSQECKNCIEIGGCSIDCKRHYLLDAVTKKEKEYLGWLKSYLFLKEEHKNNPLYGPTLLVEKTIVDGRLPRCAANNFTQWLLGRKMSPYEQDWLEELSNEFVMSNFNIKKLVRMIVMHPYFRRAQ